MALVAGDLLTGKDAQVFWGAGATEILITAWSLTKTTTPINGSDSGNAAAGHEVFGVGKRVDWKGTFEGFMRAGTPQPTFNTVMAAKFVVDKVGIVSDIELTGNILITEVGTPVDVNNSENVKVSYSFQGTSTLTETNAAV